MLIGGIISSTALSILLNLDGLIYNLIRYFYEIFLFLAKLNLFSTDDYNYIVRRIYLILGVVMLFILAYSLLKAVINPDDFSKGENSVPNIIKNVIISLIIIVILPTVFTVAFNIQNAVLNNDVIGKLIISNDDQLQNVQDKGGNTIAFYAFRAFFYPNEDFCRKELNASGELSQLQLEQCTAKIEAGSWWDKLWFSSQPTLDKSFENISINGGSFLELANYNTQVDDGTITYTFIISTIVGALLLILIIIYCLDLGIRVIKLIFYQMIAPIPVVLRIVPGNKNKAFNEWVKQTIATFISVFVRVAVMYLGIYLISLVTNKFSNTQIPGLSNLGFVQQNLVIAFLILGIVLFIKEAPKLLKDLFGIDLGGGLLPIKKMLGFGAVAGAVLGGGATALVRNAAKKDNWTNKSGKFTAGSVLKGAAGVAAGGLSGAARSGWQGRKAKNIGDMKKAASSGAKAATDAKSKREAYKASHGGTFTGAALGHLGDVGDSIKTWAGLDAGIQDLNEEKALYDEGQQFQKRLMGYVADNENVLAFEGLKKAAQERELKEYESRFVDVGGQIFEDLGNGNRRLIAGATSIEGAAVQAKTDDIKRYDDAIKLASLRAINEKMTDIDPVTGKIKDGRFAGEIEAFKVFKEQHSDISSIKSMADLGPLRSEELNKLNSALNSMSAEDISRTMKEFKGSVDGVQGASIFANNEAFKRESGRVQSEIGKKVQEKKAKDQN